MTNERNNFIWYPYTQMKTAAPPLQVERAKDCSLFTTDGKEYTDAISSWWVNIHGHCNETIASAISKQASVLEQVIFAGFTHAPAMQLSQKLIDILPSHFSKVFFSDDGSTSVEVALKMAVQYSYNRGERKRTKIIAFENAYHGDTFGAMSVAERGAFNTAFGPLLFEVRRLPLPGKNNIDEIQRKIASWGAEQDVAAFIFEPLVQGAAGMLMYEPGYLDMVIATAKENNIICIADEVMTGFGRTGKNFAIEYLRQRADIICLSKGITGGFMPLGVTICTQEIFNAFFDDDKTKAFFHGHSYTANPLACAAANAAIDLLLAEKCQEQLSSISEKHRQFAMTIQDHPSVKIIRQTGTILAIEMQTAEGTSYFNSIQSVLYQFYLDRNVLLRPLGNVVYIMPPYCITNEELEKVYAVIVDSLDLLQKVNS